MPLTAFSPAVGYRNTTIQKYNVERLQVIVINYLSYGPISRMFSTCDTSFKLVVMWDTQNLRYLLALEKTFPPQSASRVCDVGGSQMFNYFINGEILRPEIQSYLKNLKVISINSDYLPQLAFVFIIIYHFFVPCDQNDSYLDREMLES